MDKAYYFIKFTCHEGTTFGRVYKGKNAGEVEKQWKKECPRSRLVEFTKIEDIV